MSEPLTIGQLIGRTIEMYRTHFGIFLRTTTIFYIPLAVLAFFFARDLIVSTIFTTVILPIEAIVSLAIISHCVESLHGRPPVLKSAIKNSLRRLLVYIGMMLASVAVFAGIFALLAIPVSIILSATDFPIVELSNILTTSIPLDDLEAQGRQIESIMNVIDNVLWGGLGVCFPGGIFAFALVYISGRWLTVEVVLMEERVGPIESLSRSWDLTRNFVLRSIGYSLIISVTMGVLAGLIGGLMRFGLPVLLPAIDQTLHEGVNATATILVSIFIAPFYSAAIVLYYFDLRVRKEKYDFGGTKT